MQTLNLKKVKERRKVWLWKEKGKWCGCSNWLKYNCLFVFRFDLFCFNFVCLWGLRLRSGNVGFCNFSSDETDQSFYIAWTLPDSL